MGNRRKLGINTRTSKSGVSAKKRSAETNAVRAAIEAFLVKNRAAVLSTLNADGSPRGTPITYLFEDGEIFIVTHAGAEKLKNMERDGRVSICVLSDGTEQEGVQLFGKLESVEEATPQMLFPFVSLMWNTAPFLPNYMKIKSGKLMMIRIRIREAQYFYANANATDTVFKKVRF